MPLIAVDHARPGMVLASEVVDRRGRLLVPAGHELTERHLSALRMWGVTAIDVQGDDPAADPEPHLDDELLARAAAATDELFANVDVTHAFIEWLVREARRRVATDLARAETIAR